MAARASTTEQILIPTLGNKESEIWIGYTKRSCTSVNKQTKALNTEQQIIHLIEFYKLRFNRREPALLRPKLLRDSGRMFHETTSFDVENTEAATKRKVLCIGHVVDKTYLAWPLALSFVIATVVAVIAGVATHSVSSGAELGGFVGVGVVLSWSYILWLLG
ncbi:hypothetical protein J4E80_008303 [Alternaria sp. BMP 0032]|nr:hypothetical protein J4E80_008303 [Alternaria sp. BMP 0032]